MSIIQAPFSVAPCQTLISRFATFSSLHAGGVGWQLHAWWTQERVGRAEDARVRTLQQLKSVGLGHVGRDTTHERTPAVLAARRLEALHPDPAFAHTVRAPARGAALQQLVATHKHTANPGLGHTPQGLFSAPTDPSIPQRGSRVWGTGCLWKGEEHRLRGRERVVAGGIPSGGAGSDAGGLLTGRRCCGACAATISPVGRRRRQRRAVPMGGRRTPQPHRAQRHSHVDTPLPHQKPGALREERALSCWGPHGGG